MVTNPTAKQQAKPQAKHQAKHQAKSLGEAGDILDNVTAIFPESDPDFPARAAKALADQAMKEALEAKAEEAGTSVTGLAFITATRVLSIQGGVVVDNQQKDLEIVFNPPVQNPTFIITNIFNEDNHASDIGYTNLTANGVVVKRGYSMTIGGLQDFSWVALPVTNPTVGGSGGNS